MHMRCVCACACDTYVCVCVVLELLLHIIIYYLRACIHECFSVLVLYRIAFGAALRMYNMDLRNTNTILID